MWSQEVMIVRFFLKCCQVLLWFLKIDRFCRCYSCCRFIVNLIFIFTLHSLIYSYILISYFILWWSYQENGHTFFVLFVLLNYLVCLFFVRLFILGCYFHSSLFILKCQKIIHLLFVRFIQSSVFINCFLDFLL